MGRAAHIVLTVGRFYPFIKRSVASSRRHRLSRALALALRFCVILEVVGQNAPYGGVKSLQNGART
jgi:hypothetical protein